MTENSPLNPKRSSSRDGSVVIRRQRRFGNRFDSLVRMEPTNAGFDRAKAEPGERCAHVGLICMTMQALATLPDGGLIAVMARDTLPARHHVSPSSRRQTLTPQDSQSDGNSRDNRWAASWISLATPARWSLRKEIGRIAGAMRVTATKNSLHRHAAACRAEGGKHGKKPVDTGPKRVREKNS
ncbi:hypothetical protein Mal65_35810 [Crateriforma conspicua]|nr:hypothetical protein Mal65_35810 [Crateriforma conspicua]